MCDIMQVVYEELTPDGVKSELAKSKFDWYKMSKYVRIALKTDLSSIKLHVEFFSVCRIMPWKFGLFAGKWYFI